MLACIAAATEVKRPARRLADLMLASGHKPTTMPKAIASVVDHALNTVPCAAVVVPTLTGTTAR